MKKTVTKIDDFDNMIVEDDEDYEKYFYEQISNLSFNFNAKTERLNNINNIIKTSNGNYKKTSDGFIDHLLKNYQLFMNIGKFVDRIDKNLSKVTNIQKLYSNNLQKLRKDVENFSVDYVQYIKELERKETTEDNQKVKKGFYFDDFEEKTDDDVFNLNSFLNPDRKSKRWLDEQPERLRVLIDQKKFNECVDLIKEIRSCDLDKIDYEVKLEIDQGYNYLLEKLTININRCHSSKDVFTFLSHMKTLGCTGLGIDTYLNWVSKKLKSKVNKVVFGPDEFPVSIDAKINRTLEEYFHNLEKFIQIMEKFFEIDKYVAFSSYIIPWLKQEIQVMTKGTEVLFSKITKISELKNVMRHINTTFNSLDNKGYSAKFIFEIYFMNNIKLSLENILIECLQNEKIVVPFELKNLEINYESKVLKIQSVAEIVTAVEGIANLTSDFIVEFINQKQNFLGVIFLEEHFFDTLLSKDFVGFLKNNIYRAMNNNNEIKTFTESQDLPPANQYLINYGISILSIETLIDFYKEDLKTNHLILSSSLDSLKNIKETIEEVKSYYFSNLFKSKIEQFFFKYFSNNKEKLMKEVPSDKETFEPDKGFVNFFHVLKSLAIAIKSRTDSQAVLSHFILQSQFNNFLSIISSLKNLDKLYDTDFNFSRLEVNGLEIIIQGILFIYTCITRLLELDNEQAYKPIVNTFINDNLINNFIKAKKTSPDKITNSLNTYIQQVDKYITDNRVELIKGL